MIIMVVSFSGDHLSVHPRIFDLCQAMFDGLFVTGLVQDMLHGILVASCDD